jgi:8-oxo-dGTP pyrophosphatase MutT (NUDIX family)
MSTMRRFIEGAAGRAHVLVSRDGDRITVALTPDDAEALAVKRPIRLELLPVMGAYYAHYTDAGQCEDRANRWVPIAGIDAPETDIAAARREPALIAIALVASDLTARSTRAAFTVV